jgi:hypothetical protein
LNLSPQLQLPSTVLEKEFRTQINAGTEPLPDQLGTVARTVLLETERVASFVDHMRIVRMHRVSGAAKAAETRRKKAGFPDSAALSKDPSIPGPSRAPGVVLARKPKQSAAVAKAGTTPANDPRPPPKRHRGSTAASKRSGSEKETNDQDENEVVDTLCSVCLSGRFSLSKPMLLCNGCDSGLHMACASPKITREPADLWFCEACARDAAALPARKQVVLQFLLGSPLLCSLSVDDVLNSVRTLRDVLVGLGQLDENVALSVRGLSSLGLNTRNHVITLLAKAIEQQQRRASL